VLDKMRLLAFQLTGTGLAADGRDYAGNYKMVIAHGVWVAQATVNF